MPRIRGMNEPDGWAALRALDFNASRVHTGVIASVSASEGTMRVVVEQGTGFKTAIPCDVSLTPAGASWRRWIPQVGTRVLVGYDVADRPRVLGYCLYEALNSLDQGDAVIDGYATMLRRATNESVPQLAAFTQLKAGEFDQRSLGGAYIKGDNSGQLLLGGRGERLSIDGGQSEISGEAACYRLESRGGYIRFGETRGGFPNSVIPLGPTDFKSLLFEQPVVSGSGTQLDVLSPTRARFQLGDIRALTPGPGAPISLMPRMTTPRTTLVPEPVVFSLRAYPGAAPALSAPPAEGIVAAHNALEQLPLPMASIEGTATGALALQATTAVHITAPLVAVGPVPGAAAVPTNFVAKATPIALALQTLAAQLNVIASAVAGLASPTTAAAAAGTIAGACQTAAGVIDAQLAAIPSTSLQVA